MLNSSASFLRQEKSRETTALVESLWISLPKFLACLRKSLNPFSTAICRYVCRGILCILYIIKQAFHSKKQK